MYDVILTTQARIDLNRALDWYDENTEKQGDRFFKTMRGCFSSLAKNPYTSGYLQKPLRSMHLPVFPYYIVYEVVSDKQVRIFRIMHDKQDTPAAFR